MDLPDSDEMMMNTFKGKSDQDNNKGCRFYGRAGEQRTAIPSSSSPHLDKQLVTVNSED
jgi:hypothetical protein